MRIVTLHRTRYAIGLWWQFDAAPSGLGRAGALARSLGGQQYAWAVVRARQFGLGAGRGAFRGLPSLAAALADKGGSHLYVCRFGVDLWWVCAIKDGVIAAEGDWIGPSEEAAAAQAGQLRQMLDLPAPRYLTEADETAALARDLRGKSARRFFARRSDNRVRALRSPVRRFVRLAAILAAACGLFWLYQTGFFGDGAAERAAREARRQAILAHPEQFFPQPWLKTPQPAAWAGRCLTELFALPVLDRGWELKSATCNNDDVLTVWNFTEVASFLHLPDQAELITATTAQKKTSLPRIEPGGAVTLLPREEVARRLYEIAHRLELHLTVTWKPKAKRTVREGTLAVPLTAPWQMAEFTLKDVSPQLILEPEFYQVLQSIPGLVLQQLTHTNGQWELKGLCHGK